MVWVFHADKGPVIVIPLSTKLFPVIIALFENSRVISSKTLFIN